MWLFCFKFELIIICIIIIIFVFAKSKFLKKEWRSLSMLYHIVEETIKNSQYLCRMRTILCSQNQWAVESIIEFFQAPLNALINVPVPGWKPGVSGYDILIHLWGLYECRFFGKRNALKPFTSIICDPNCRWCDMVVLWWSWRRYCFICKVFFISTLRIKRLFGVFNFVCYCWLSETLHFTIPL